MNSESLNYKINQEAKKSNLQVELVYRNYMFERFLFRLSLSSYRNNFVIKGGFLIGSLVGISNRLTKDLDATLQSIILDKDRVLSLMESIIHISVDDGLVYEIKQIQEIRLASRYPAYRVSFDALFEKTIIHLKLDLTTGDSIYPRAIEYNHNCMFDDNPIALLAYPLENILAEKLEAILTWGILGKRIRDYYDVYVLSNFEYDNEELRNALYLTAQTRNTKHHLENYKIVFETIKNEASLENEWIKYTNEYSYAKGITYPQILQQIELVLNKLKL